MSGITVMLGQCLGGLRAVDSTAGYRSQTRPNSNYGPTGTVASVVRFEMCVPVSPTCHTP